MSLEADDFLEVPAELEESLCEIFTGMCNTRIVENGFKLLRSASEQSTRKQLCRQTRWRRTQVHDLFPEYGRELVKPGPQDKLNAASVLPPKAFEADSAEFSLGSAALRGLTLPSWKGMSADVHHLSGLLAKSLVELGDPRSVTDLWLNELFVVGSCVQHTPSGNHYLVVSSSAFGALLWKATVEPFRRYIGGGGRCLRLSLRGSGDWQWAHIGDHLSWRAMVVQPLTPLALSAIGPVTGGFGLLLALLEAPVSIVHFKAKLCFENMAMKGLEKLYVNLQVPGKRPRTEARLLQALLEFVLPGVDEKGLRDILQLRGKTYEESLLFEADNLEDVSDLMDDMDLKEAKEQRKQHVTKKAAQQAKKGDSEAIPAPQAPPAPAGGHSSSSSSSGQPAPHASRRKQIPPDLSAHSSTPAELKRLLPNIPGVSLTRDTRLHFRWVAKYPRHAPPYSNSKAFGKFGTEQDQQEALKVVLRWVWSEHTEATGESCPWDI